MSERLRTIGVTAAIAGTVDMFVAVPLAAHNIGKAMRAGFDESQAERLALGVDSAYAALGGLALSFAGAFSYAYNRGSRPVDVVSD